MINIDLSKWKDFEEIERASSKGVVAEGSIYV